MVLVVLLIIGIRGVQGQDFYSAKDYYLHEHTLFPAATGVNYYPVLGLSYNKQWAGLLDSPNRVVVGLNWRLGKYDFYTPKMLLNKSKRNTKERMGIGLAFKQDRNGPLLTSNLITSYAYHLPLFWATMSFGMDLSFNEVSINQANLDPNDPNDPYLFSDQSSENYFQSSFGFQLSNEMFFASIAARNLFKNEKLNEIGYSRTAPDYFVYLGYTQSVNKYIKVEPSIFAYGVDQSDYAWELGAKMYVRSLNWVSVNYNSIGSVKANFTLHAIYSIQLGYGIEYYLDNIESGSYTGHCIYIGRNFGVRNMHGIRKNVKQKFL